MGKKSKNDDDLFGLNSLLGLNGDEQNEPEEEVGNPIDLNDQSEAMNVSLRRTNEEEETEVDETIRLGARLGVQLQEQRQFVKEAILGKGVQAGVK